MLKKFEKNLDDFEAYMEVFHRVGFSKSVHQKSERKEASSEGMYPRYCGIVDLFDFHCLGYESNGKIIGGVRFGFVEKRTAFFYYFAVLPENQLEGNGSAFYRELEEYLKSNYRVRQIQLISGSPGSQRFWVKMGFSLITPIHMQKWV